MTGEITGTAEIERVFRAEYGRCVASLNDFDTLGAAVDHVFCPSCQAEVIARSLGIERLDATSHDRDPMPLFRGIDP